MRGNLLEKIKDAGVVGAGGAGFPTHVKLSSKADYLIINGAECEPLLRVDQQLMYRDAEKLLDCIEKLVSVFEFKKAYLCIKKKHKEAIERLKGLIKTDKIEIFTLDDFYPAGDEQVTVYEVTKRIVPEGSIPLKVGCIVLNAETILNIRNSFDSIPVTDTWLTVSGEVPRPVTLRLPIGMRIIDALKIAGLNGTEGKAVIDGGPMMGKVLTDFESPVTKTTKGLIVLEKTHPLIASKTLDMASIIKRSRSACIQCTQCSCLCPRNLLGHNLYPHKIMRSLNYSREDLDSYVHTLICSECNVCELYACPMGLSPRAVNAAFKKELLSSGIRYPAKDKTYNASPAREFRKIPVKALIRRLKLKAFDVEAPVIHTSFIPEMVAIPLKQHAGAASVPLVNAGQEVVKGQLIADIPQGSLGAKIHASISGRVKEVSGFIIIESGGKPC